MWMRIAHSHDFTELKCALITGHGQLYEQRS